jgi:hypothetical protein
MPRILIPWTTKVKRENDTEVSLLSLVVEAYKHKVPITTCAVEGGIRGLPSVTLAEKAFRAGALELVERFPDVFPEAIAKLIVNLTDAKILARFKGCATMCTCVVRGGRDYLM